MFCLSNVLYCCSSNDVKHPELPFCLKCAMLINLPCLIKDWTYSKSDLYVVAGP